MLIIAAFVDIVHSSNGTMHKAVDDDSMKNDNTEHSRTNKKGEKKKKSTSIIPSHVMKTDISGLKGETLVFANMIFCILPCAILCQLHLFFCNIQQQQQSSLLVPSKLG
jgi:hypothetical protein